MSRQIAVDEQNQNLRYIYFDIRGVDGISPALNEAGEQPQININGLEWQSEYIGPLEHLGFGKYRALLSLLAIHEVGSIILSRYKSANTVETPGEEVEVVAASRLIIQFDTSDSSSTSSYGSIEEADNYFEGRLGTDAWDQASPSDKARSLLMATRAVDRLAFKGDKTTATQNLEFPRFGEFDVPQDIKLATYECAIKYLEGIDLEQEIQNLFVTEQRISNIGDTYTRVFADEAKRAGIPSYIAWTYLRPYLRNALNLTLRRV